MTAAVATPAGPAKPEPPPSPEPEEPTAISGLRLTPGDGAIELDWSPATSAPYGYLVRWRVQGADMSTVQRSVVSGGRFTITGLTNGVRYIVSVDTNFDSGHGILSPRRWVTKRAMPRADRDREESPPNIVLIVADDLGYADVGFHGLTEFETPNLDDLAESGIRFSAGYVTSPICSPSRAGLMTGRYQQVFGYMFNPRAGFNQGIPGYLPLLPALLAKGGYGTKIVGKWHLGDSLARHPLRKGFDEFLGFTGGGHDYFTSFPNTGYYLQTELYDGYRRVPVKGYLTDQFTDAAVDFIERHRDRPFFLYLAYNAPHSPLQAPASALERVTSIEDPSRRTYAAMVTVLDRGVGEVMRRPASLGLTDHTLVFFLSDNGGSHAGGSERVDSARSAVNRPLSRGKGSLAEGGIRVPFVVSWPGRLEAGKTYDYPVSSIDILPTALAVAGLAEPQNVDGVDLMPYLTGEKSSAPHAQLLWSHGPNRRVAIRTLDRKLYKEATRLITPQNNSAARLYAIQEDVGEEHDLAAQEPVKAHRLLESVVAWTATHRRALWKQ